MKTQETSRLARTKVDIQKHHGIIMNVLENSQSPLTSFGISLRCSLNYHAVARRLKELVELGRIEIVGKRIDVDKAARCAYQIKK